MSHLTDERLSAMADGALAGGALAAAERHLGTCPRCRAALAGIVSQDRALAATLEHDPGEAYFESFAGRVGGRIRAAGLAGAQASGPEGRSLAAWFRSPRKLTLVGAVATVVAGAGIVMFTSREMRVPALREQEIESRVAQEAPPAQPPPGILAGSQRPAPPVTRSAAPPAERIAADIARPREESQAKASAVSGAEPAPAVPERHAPTSRAYEVRRNAAGEDVPVGRRDGFIRRPPQAAPAPSSAAPGEPVRVQKRRYAESLGAGPSQDDLRSGARPLPADAGAPAAAGQEAPVAVATPREESTSAAAPIAEPAVTARKGLAAPGRLLGLADQGDRQARGPALQVRGTPEAFNGLPVRSRALAKDAQRLTTIAETVGLAPAWDAAAAAWERAIDGVQGGPLESETRFQAARARFRAWQRAANEKRGAAATQALHAFLDRAPEGAERDTAQAWLANVRK